MKAGILFRIMSRWDREDGGCTLPSLGADRVRRVNLAEGTLHNFAGIGETCYSGDEGWCVEADCICRWMWPGLAQ